MTIKIIKTMFQANVLVVDDMTSSREMSAMVIENFGCTVDTASGGQEAIEKCKNTKYDLIFMDLIMPDIDGFQAAIEIRKNISASIQIVGLSGNLDSKEVISRCIKVGMNDCLIKPLDMVTLEPRLEAWKINKTHIHQKVIQ